VCKTLYLVHYNEKITVVDYDTEHKCNLHFQLTYIQIIRILTVLFSGSERWPAGLGGTLSLEYNQTYNATFAT